MDYGIIVILIFPLCTPPPSTPYSLKQSPHHCSCPWVMHISSSATPFPILYCTSPWLFCNCLFVLVNPLTSSPIPPLPLPSGNHQNVHHIHDSVSVLVCLVCVLHSKLLKDMGFFCHFIVHSFKKIILLLLSYSCLHLPLTILFRALIFFLNKSL